jgi:hypothetical protein
MKHIRVFLKRTSKNASQQGIRWRKELEQILRGQSVDFAAFQ